MQILSTVGAQSVVFVSVGLVASRQNVAIPSSSGKSLPTQRLPTVVPVVWVNGFASQAVVIVPVQSVAFVLVVASVSRQNVSRAIKSSVQSVSNGLSVQTPLIVAVQSAVFVGVILVASLQNTRSAAWSGVQVISNALLMQASAIVAVQSAVFVGVVLAASRQNTKSAIGSAEQRLPTVVPVVWINLSAAQAVFIVPVQLASFPAGVRLVSRQNTKSATGSAEQRLPTVVPVVWANLSAAQAVFIVPVQSVAFVAVALAVSRQNISRATGSAVQSPLNGLLVQRVVRAVLAGVKYLAKSALFAHAVSNGLVRHGTDSTADSQVGVAAASPARHSVIFISCAVSAAAVLHPSPNGSVVQESSVVGDSMSVGATAAPPQAVTINKFARLGWGAKPMELANSGRIMSLCDIERQVRTHLPPPPFPPNKNKTALDTPAHSH